MSKSLFECNVRMWLKRRPFITIEQRMVYMTYGKELEGFDDAVRRNGWSYIANMSNMTITFKRVA